MRVWDVPPRILCRQHLLGEHREIHAIWTILTEDKPGYRNHPEVQRWQGKLQALYNRHQTVVKEMEERGFTHASPLDEDEATGDAVQETYIDSAAEQRRILKAKPCNCPRDEQ